LDEVVLTEGDRRRLLQARYEQVFGAKPKAMLVPMLEIDEASPLAEATPERQEEAWAAELEQRVQARIPLDAGDLRQLAQARSAAVRDYLIDGGVSAERIFVLDVEVGGGHADEAPVAELSLTAH
jgi:hypothetical protein